MKKKIKDNKLAITTVILFVSLLVLSRFIPLDNIRKIVEASGNFAPIVYILLALITLVFAPISGSPLVYVGIHLFGHSAIVYFIVASYISFALNFWISRLWGRNILKKFVGSDGLGKVDKLSKSYGLPTLIALRLFQGGISDFVSYAAGLTLIDFKKYYIISIISALPGNLLYYYVSTYLQSPELIVAYSWLQVAVFTMIFFIGRYLFRNYRRIKVHK